MAPTKTRAPRRFAELDERPAKDYDPENDEPVDDDDDGEGAGEGSGDEDGTAAATEHYVPIGKSKLRQNLGVSLGPKYRGTRISRAALEESSEEEEEAEGGASGSEEYDDPETADPEADGHGAEDEEIDSDEAFGESDLERFKGFTFRGSSKPSPAKGQRMRRPKAADFLSSSEDEEALSEDGDGGESDDDEDEDMMSGEEESDDEDEEEEEDSEFDDDDESPEVRLREMLQQEKKKVMAPLSQSAKTEAEKGFAVRQQRRSFDSLLNIRIRLQKALVAVNSLNAVAEDREAGADAFQAAEEAALKLWSTVDSFRGSLLPETSAKAGEKRKRTADLDSSSQAIWEMMVETEDRASARRKKILEKWSAKVQRRPDATTTRRLVAAPTHSFVSALDDQLLNSDRLVKRTRTPRSCAPAQVAKKVDEDPDIYDDADFYQLLLKELVDQRSADVSAPGNAVPTVRWAALKEVKNRKQVDRKASKGRKLRFDVHEKLQNFMAPEDRRSWEQEAIDRFFGALFGRKTELGEDEADSDKDEDMAGAPVMEASDGLRLF